MEYFGPIAGMLCWLIANSMLMDDKVKKLTERIKDLEKSQRDR